jgi:hypothetical protein
MAGAERENQLSIEVCMENKREHRRHQLLSDIAISFVVGSLISTFVLGRLIDPHSKVGQFVFWPQEFLSFLRFSSNSSIAPRIMFAVIVCGVSLLVWMVLTLATPRHGGHVRHFGYGVLAIVAPMLCWLVVKGAHLAWAGSALTIIYIAGTVWFSAGKWALHVGTWYILLLFWQGWWIYLFRKELDPVMLLVPLFSLCAILAWTTARVETP